MQLLPQVLVQLFPQPVHEVPQDLEQLEPQVPVQLPVQAFTHNPVQDERQEEVVPCLVSDSS